MEQGTVTNVSYNNGGVMCDVVPLRFDTTYSDVPVLKPHSSFNQIPKENQLVMMDKIDENTRFITHVLNREGAYPSNVREGDFSIQLDEDTKIEIKKNKNNNYDLNISSSGDLSLTANGDIDLSANGEVVIQGIPFLSHRHPYTDDEIPDTGTGGSSQIVQDKVTGDPQD